MNIYFYAFLVGNWYKIVCFRFFFGYFGRVLLC